MNEKMKIQLSQSDISKCIHCSNPINNSEKTVVEIDLHHLANNMKLKVDTIGVIHDECIKPNDRYLGLINFSNSINEIDSGLDVDAIKTVANVINSMLDGKKSILMITHYDRLLELIKPDFVHILNDGKIVKTGDYSLALELDEKGYEAIGIKDANK
jgi:hypothetical protein